VRTHSSDGGSEATTTAVEEVGRPEAQSRVVKRQLAGKKGQTTEVEVDYGRVDDLLAAADALPFTPLTGGELFWTKLRLAFAWPWRRFKQDSVLTLKIGGQISEEVQPRFSSTPSLPQLCLCLRKAALDPRIVGVAIKVEPLAIGWAKLQELVRHIDHFRASGKFAVAYMELGGEKEYYLASACSEVILPPSANLSLRGLSVSGTFLRGVLDKIGVEPEVRRIGQYKSAGDQLLRKDMSAAQREQLSALLDDIYDGFVEEVARRRGKKPEEVKSLIDRGVYDMRVLLEEGWVDRLAYEGDVEDMLKERTDGKPDELRQVGYQKYSRVSPSAFQIGAGKACVAVLRASGAITGTGGGGTSQGITAKKVVAKLRKLAKDPSVTAIVLRIDSPGGDALASDIMWSEIKRVVKSKPIVASMGDVAASGGYYMAMGCERIVAERLTLTGSIGVVTGKFSLQDFYEKIGYAKETISKGRYAQVLLESRPLSEDESELFDRQAQYAYESFRNKAAESRGKEPEEMERYAQGRVWAGTRAMGVGLVDGLGGLSKAIEVAKALAGIPVDQRVRIREVSRAEMSPLQLLTAGSSMAAVSEAEGLAWEDSGKTLWESWAVQALVWTFAPAAVAWVAGSPLGGQAAQWLAEAGARLGSGAGAPLTSAVAAAARRAGVTADAGRVQARWELAEEVVEQVGAARPAAVEARADVDLRI